MAVLFAENLNSHWDVGQDSHRAEPIMGMSVPAFDQGSTVSAVGAPVDPSTHTLTSNDFQALSPALLTGKIQ